MTKLARLFEPGKIGKIELKNRLVMAPMATKEASEEGYVSERIIEHYVTRAEGGVGFIITEANPISAETPGRKRWLNISDDKFIPRLRELAQAVQARGTKIALQLWHGGPVLGYFGYPELAVGPSPVPVLAYGKICSTPSVLSKDDIKNLVNDFSEAARRVKEAGFDAVEIHGGYYYLLSAFQSPLTNKRTDGYGGNPEKRARFGCEVIAAIREEVGSDFPIILRMNGHDFVDKDGLTIEEALLQAPLFVEAGVNALHVRDGFGIAPVGMSGYNIAAAAAIKKAVKVPVIVVGRIDPLLGEQTLKRGEADFIAIARGLLADPNLPNKVREDRLGEVCPCINCNECNLAPEHVICLVNAAVGREADFRYEPTKFPKKVMVVGGGLAGMEAGRILAERGHQVALYEKNGKLGGQWNVAASEPGKESYGVFTDYLSTCLKRLGVNVIMNKEVTAELVRGSHPDVVVLATGAKPLVPNIPGIKGKNVVLAHDVITGKASVGEMVVVIGARLTGLEVAVELAEKGKRVTLVDQYEIAGDLPAAKTGELIYWIEKVGVQMFPYSPVIEIKEDGIIIDKEGETHFIPADTVVLATGMKPENKLIAELKGIISEVYPVGDCVEPRNGVDAIYEGAKIGREI